MMNLRVFALFLLTSLGSPALAQSRCQNELKQGARQENERLEHLYRSLSKGEEGLRPGNGGRVRLGSNGEGILLLHGFIASPYEVDVFARVFQEAGYTVYEPLIAGFGASARIANAVTRDDWRVSFRNALRPLLRCYGRVHVVGFSLGSTLALDLLASDDPADRALAARVKSVSLLSPYVRANMRASRLLNALMKVFTRTVRLEKLFSLSKNADLVIPMENPPYYNASMPLKAVSQTLSLTKEVRYNSRGKVFKTPAYMAYTHADATVDVPTALEYFAARFSDRRSREFAEEQGVPHQLGMSDVAGLVARDVLRLID